MSIKVFLIEDHEIVRHGLRALLNGDEIEIVGEASNGIEALEKFEQVTCDLVLMDMNMPGMNGIECTKELKKKYPHVKILILSMHDHDSYLINMLDAGADGYILKNSSKEELLFAIKKIVNNGIYIGSEFTLGMLEKYKMQQVSLQTKKTSIKLTEREQEVLELMAKGYTNLEMAQKLFNSVRTIETRRKKLLEKTGTTNTATLIHFATLHGLI
ncbi:MAG TPA: response regulator transcription factor [Bacteroidia bacterium]